MVILGLIDFEVKYELLHYGEGTLCSLGGIGNHSFATARLVCVLEQPYHCEE